MTNEPPAAAPCWCCCSARPAEELVRLGCHPEVALCGECIGWLGAQRGGRDGMRDATPILVTADLSKALARYRALGFDATAWDKGAYGFVRRDGVEFHLGEEKNLDPAANTAGCYLEVDDADQLHARWSAAHVAGRLDAPEDTPYGLREGRYVDPDGNSIRFGSPMPPARFDGLLLADGEQLTVDVVTAIRTGDVARLSELLVEHPELAEARIGDRNTSRTLLHIATDWPGHLPNVAATIARLAAAGAPVNARFIGSNAETPLHWAASSNDLDALDGLLAAGADLEASGAVLWDGSPLADAVGFGQWAAARRLVDHGANMRLMDAAALGLADRVAAALNAEPAPSTQDVTEAFWQACHGGQLATAAMLLDHGADANWNGWGNQTPLDIARQSNATHVADWLEHHGARAASDQTA